MQKLSKITFEPLNVKTAQTLICAITEKEKMTRFISTLVRQCGELCFHGDERVVTGKCNDECCHSWSLSKLSVKCTR